VHVFITGFFVDPATGSVSGEEGVGCSGSLTEPAYAVFTDSPLAVGEDAISLMVHELGHVLGLDESATSRVEDTFFAVPEEPFPVTASDEDACTTMRLHADTYQQDFSIYPARELP
jgi:hypothetical protein